MKRQTQPPHNAPCKTSCAQTPSQTPQSSDGAGAGDAGHGGPDVVALGFQEVVALNAPNALLGPSGEGADAWDAAVAATLNGEEW